MNLRTKLLLISGLLVCLAIALGVTSLISARHLGTELSDAVNITAKQQMLAGRVNTNTTHAFAL
jgi:hypothetical protein